MSDLQYPNNQTRYMRNGQPLLEPIWIQQPNETSKAYTAFLKYRDLGKDRTLEKAAQAVRSRTSDSPSRLAGAVTAWSSRYSWRQRVLAWDAHLQEQRDKAARMAAAREAAREAAKWEKRRQESLEENYTTSCELRNKARAMLQAPLFETETISEDGKTITKQKPAKWGFSTVALYAKVAADIEAGVLNAASKALGELTIEELQAVAEAAAGNYEQVSDSDMDIAPERPAIETNIEESDEDDIIIESGEEQPS